MNIDQILSAINDLNEEDLVYLNSAVVQNIKALRTRKADAIKDSLSVGDAVTFTGRRRGRNGGRFPVEGVVTKIKRKNAEVKGNTDGLRWNVPIALLQRKAS